jgi:hypothetical protein
MPMIKHVCIFAFVVLVFGCAAQQKCPDCVCNPAASLDCPASNVSAVPSGDDYSRCPKITIVKNLTYLRYVCPNGLVADVPQLCFPRLDVNMTPVLSNENNSYIDYVSVEPGCIYGVNGGTVKFQVQSIARDIVFQLKAGDEYKDVLLAKNLFSGVRYFVISDRQGLADFKLDPFKVYLFRLKFFLPGFNVTQYSNEHIIDTRTGSVYSVKKCSG